MASYSVHLENIYPPMKLHMNLPKSHTCHFSTRTEIPDAFVDLCGAAVEIHFSLIPPKNILDVISPDLLVYFLMLQAYDA